MTERPNIETVRSRFIAATTASARPIAEIESAAGLKRDRLRDFLSRRKESVDLVSAAALAIELGVSLEWLADMPPRSRP